MATGGLGFRKGESRILERVRSDHQGSESGARKRGGGAAPRSPHKFPPAWGLATARSVLGVSEPWLVRRSWLVGGFGGG